MNDLPRAAYRRGALGLALVVALAFVLLFAQFLGQSHRSAHGMASSLAGFQSVGSVHSHPQGQGHDDGHEHLEAGVLAHFFSGHQNGSAECHAFDQLSHIDVMPSVSALALPLVIQPFLLAISSGLATARWHALFQARGPPSLR